MKIHLGFLLYLAIGLLFGCHNSIIEKTPLNIGINTEPSLKSQSIADLHSHPRILLNDSTLNVLKYKSKTDILLQNYINDILREADFYLNYPTLTYQLQGGVTLSPVSRNCLYIMEYFGFAYRWTGNIKYAQAAGKHLLAVCNFPDWHPSSYLGTAEMMGAVAIGYDWLYNLLNVSQRTIIENAIYKYGLMTYLDLFYNGYSQRITGSTNWNLVLNSSAIIGALAVSNIYPEKSQEVIQIALANLPQAIKAYAPSGIWPEGLTYWSPSTEYTIYAIQSLNNEFGTDYGLSNINGFSNSGCHPIYLLSPGNSYFNFNDGSETLKNGDAPKPSLFWLGKQYNNPMFINEEHKYLKKYNASILDVLFYTEPRTETESRTLDKYFDSEVPISVFRSSWNDPYALWLATKAGNNNPTSGNVHLDLGNFQMEALGVMWACDLGSDNYFLPGYWAYPEGGQRWTYYRVNSHSHNVPMINNMNQLVSGIAIVKSHAENISEPFITFDLTSAYSNDAYSVVREIKIINNRKAVQITDVFNLKAQSDIYWGMTTPATIKVLSNGEALLTNNGKQLTAKIVSPIGASFYAESCYQALPQNPNTGYSRLMAKGNRLTGTLTLKITLTPKY